MHVHRVRVGFGDCDPAGIVYFPRFFHFFHEAMETWFDAVLRLPYAELIGVRRLGFPAVHTGADFLIPCAMGDEIAVEQRVISLGRTSIRFAYRVRTPFFVPISRWEYDITPEGAGCRLTVTNWLRVPGWFVPFAIFITGQPDRAGTNSTNIATTLERLKAHVEA